MPCCLLVYSWNFTPSPGWSKEESLILKLCLMKFGIGQWVQIQATGLLPGKLIQQLNGAAQRLLGQQSLAGEGRSRERAASGNKATSCRAGDSSKAGRATGCTGCLLGPVKCAVMGRR